MGRKLTQEEVESRISNSFAERIEVIGKYQTKRDPIELHCLECDYIWAPIAQNVMYVDTNRAAQHHCPNCGNPKTGKHLNCAYCGKEIYRSLSDINKNISGYFYCSRECGNNHKNLLRKESGEWDDGSSNYRSRAMESYEHKCFCCGWDEDERILEAHHLDENRKNNKISNLRLLCPTCHRKITLGYYKLDLESQTLIKISFE